MSAERPSERTPRLDMRALFERRQSERASPTLTWWRGRRRLQHDLASEVAKQIDYLALQANGFEQLIGDNPFADPRIAAALPTLLDDLMRASATLDLLVMCCQDQGGDTEKPKAKTVAEEQEEQVDGWKKDFEKDFEQWKKDTKSKQKFDDYWDWIKKFFITAKLGFLEKAVVKKATKKDATGWLDLIDKLTKAVAPAANKDKLRKKMVELGKKIAKEFGKDGGKIKATDLPKWAGDLEKAAEADTGDGAEIDKAIDKIDGEVDAKLK